MRLKVKTKNTDLEMGVTKKEGNESKIKETLTRGLVVVGLITVSQLTIGLIEKDYLKK